MPNKPIKGGKKRTRGKKERGPQTGAFVLKGQNAELDQLYGKVTARLGGKPPILEIECEDGKSRTCVVRGKMIKKCYMNPGDIVLINYNKDLPGGEIEKKYSEQEISKLKKLGEISNDTFKNTTNENGESNVEFTEISDHSVINKMNSTNDDNNANDNSNNFSFDFSSI